MEKTILVTGGCGFIGSHTVVELIQLDYTVIIIDNLSNSSIQVLDSIETITGTRPKFHQVDICVKEDLEPIFNLYKFDTIIHFASLKSVGESVSNPLLYYKSNINGLINLLEFVTKYSINNFVFSSSATVYGSNICLLDMQPSGKSCLSDLQPSTSGFKETDPIGQGLTNPYGETKYFQECILQSYVRTNPKFTAIILRYFNPAGSHKSGLLKENPKGIPNNLVPYISQVASGQRPHLNIFGTDYDTPDGTCIRDYIHVVDLAQGHIAAINNLKFKPGMSCLKGLRPSASGRICRAYPNLSEGTHIYNLGSGKGTSVLELVKTFEQVTNQSIKYICADRRVGDIPVSVANVDKAFEDFGWKTKLSIKDICASI